jgi:hypothetical protein
MTGFGTNRGDRSAAEEGAAMVQFGIPQEKARRKK